MKYFVEWVIKHSLSLIYIYIVLLLITIFGLYYITNERIGICALYSIGVMMGDSPDPPNHFNIVMPYRLWLYGIRFFGWLLIPALVGVIVNDGQQRIVSLHEQRILEEQRIEETEDDLRNAWNELEERGLVGVKDDILRMTSEE